MIRQYRQRFREFYETIRWRKRLARTFILAWIHRLWLPHTTFIGITGSAGKTTSKDLSSLILSAFYPTRYTPESDNTPIIIAETILDTSKKHKFCVVEIGAFKPNVLDLPLFLLKPKIGVLTLIGRDHFKAFQGKGIDGIALEKAKLIEALPEDGTAVLNLDDPRVKAIGERCKARVIWVGKGEGATIRLLETTSRYPEPLKLVIEYEGNTFDVLTGLHGTHLALSVLSALGVALAAGITLEQSIPQLAKALPTEGRMQIVSGEDGITFVRDDMKAPYWSLQAPLEFMRQATASRKIAVIGSISDFSGDNSDKYRQFAREIRSSVDLVVFVGQNAHRALRARTDENDQVLQGFLTLREAAVYLRKILQPGDLVLLKGSNKVDHLERLVFDRNRPIECWRERCGLDRFCDSCPQLYQIDQAGQSVSENIPLATSAATGLSMALPAIDRAVPVIAGLGNPGPEYANTVHNIGHHVLDHLASYCNGTWETTEDGQVCSTILAGSPILLFKPAAYMNETGPVLRRFLEKTDSPLAQCLIIYDDIDIDLGKIRLKNDGGDAGHKGMRSCLSAFGTTAVRRLRVGVRQPGETGKAIDHVLSEFTADMQTYLPKILDQVVVMIEKDISDRNTVNT